jgi:hypothetical protein
VVRRVILLALVGLSVSGLALSGMAVPGPAFAAVALDVSSDLVVSKVDTTSYPQVSMVVAPPRLLAPRDLGAEAFSVTENGEARPVSVARFPNSGLQIVLVLDPSVPPNVFRAAQAAALDFLLRLPAGTRVALISAGEPPRVTLPSTLDLAAVPQAVGNLSPGRGRAIHDAVRRAEAEFRPGEQVRRTVLVFTGGRDTSSSIALDALRRQLTSTGTSLYAVELSSGDSGGALATVATEAGGRSVKVASTELVGAYQRVADVLLNQYRVTFEARSRGRASLAIRVAAEGISEERALGVELTAPEAAPDAARTVVSSERGGGRAVAEPFAAGLAIVMALLAGGVLMSLGRAGLRSRSTPTGQRGTTR